MNSQYNTNTMITIYQGISAIQDISQRNNLRYITISVTTEIKKYFISVESRK